MADRAPYRQWEEELLAEYLARFHQGARILQRVRLGPPLTDTPLDTLPDAERRLLGAAYRRWADAILFDNGILWVVEAAMIPDPGDISRVDTYLLLVGRTPELQEFWSWPRRGMLLWAVEDPFAAQIAVERGHVVRVFKPSHWLEYLRVHREREGSRPTRAPRAPADLATGR